MGIPSFPWPARWLKERKEDYGAASVEQMCASSYALWLREHLRRLLSGCVEKLERVQELCEAPDGPYMYGELVDRELEQLKALMPTWGAEQKEDMGEEILNLRTKYAIKLEDRKRLGRLKDFFQRDLIRSNPGMTSVKFREALEELKRRTFGKED